MKRGICALLALVLLLSGCGKTKGKSSWQEQYDLGVRYLSQGKYEEAILAFQAAIEIDPKKADAYMGLADAYEKSGDIDAARDALEKGLKKAEDTDDLEKRLEELEKPKEETPPADQLEQKDPQPDFKPEPDPLDGPLLPTGAPGEIRGTMTISDLVWEMGNDTVNPGAVGMLMLSYTLEGPAEVVIDRIWTWRDAGYADDEIDGLCRQATDIWKQGEIFTDGAPTPPYSSGSGFPVREDDLGKVLDVLLVGCDKNCDPVAWAVVTVQVPGEAPAPAPGAKPRSKQTPPELSLEIYSPRSMRVTLTFEQLPETFEIVKESEDDLSWSTFWNVAFTNDPSRGVWGVGMGGAKADLPVGSNQVRIEDMTLDLPEYYRFVYRSGEMNGCISCPLPEERVTAVFTRSGNQISWDVDYAEDYCAANGLDLTQLRWVAITVGYEGHYTHSSYICTGGVPTRVEALEDMDLELSYNW